MKKIALAICAVFLLFNTPLPASYRGSVSEVYFSPQDGIADRLISLIDAEQESIRVAIYCLMHSGVAKALKEAHARGVDIEVIVDPFSVKTRSPVARMVEKGVSVYVWNPKQPPVSSDKKQYPRRSLMHDKFCVFGKHTVWTGSFNFTRDANVLHRENVIVLRGQEIAETYLNEFASIKASGCCSYKNFVKNRPSSF